MVGVQDACSESPPKENEEWTGECLLNFASSCLDKQHKWTTGNVLLETRDITSSVFIICFLICQSWRGRGRRMERSLQHPNTNVIVIGRCQFLNIITNNNQRLYSRRWEDGEGRHIDKQRAGTVLYNFPPILTISSIYGPKNPNKRMMGSIGDCSWKAPFWIPSTSSKETKEYWVSLLIFDQVALHVPFENIVPSFLPGHEETFREFQAAATYYSAAEQPVFVSSGSK